jgi:NAD+ diphosphatase
MCMPSFSARLPLSRTAIDRDYLTRERPDLWAELAADETARVLVLRDRLVLMTAPLEVALVPAADLPGLAEPAGDAETPDAQPTGIRERIYLGRTIADEPQLPAGTPVVAVVVDDDLPLDGVLRAIGAGTSETAGDDWRWGDLRRIGAELSARDAGLATQALGMANWHAVHGFSPRSGAATIAGKGGWVRVDPTDDTEVFPRTDPAIIVGVVDREDRILLGSNAMWGGDRYSVLAGFVEPGESLEQAVIREVFEESGVVVVDPEYLGSQPWPFPASLMVGFVAHVDPETDGVPTPDGTEILELKWFSREQIVSSGIQLPGPTSIARAILEHWYGGPIEGADWK